MYHQVLKGHHKENAPMEPKQFGGTCKVKDTNFPIPLVKEELHLGLCRAGATS